MANDAAFYQGCPDVHDLPAIFHYWSNRHLKPILQGFGLNDPVELFRRRTLEHCAKNRRDTCRIASIGAGNCSMELTLAAQLRDAGCKCVHIECLDVIPHLLERGRQNAALTDSSDLFSFSTVDLNHWLPDRTYDVVIANQVLHHVVNLEHLFSQIKGALNPSGIVLISDMIGRNGHQRWPEALGVVDEFWRRLPPSYRFNTVLERYEEWYADWDCSTDSFEGIRSQDVLAQLLQYFQFELFIGFGNVIDPFVDRAFGPHFNVASPWDRQFIDEVHERDEAELHAGRLTPTHMLAVAGVDIDGPTRFRDELSPERCLRHPAAAADGAVRRDRPYADEVWQRLDYRMELENACRRLKESAECINGLRAEAQRRSRWGLEMNQEFSELVARYNILEQEFNDRSKWALTLDSQLRESGAKYRQLEQEFKDRTEWALKLDQQLRELTAEPPGTPDLADGRPPVSGWRRRLLRGLRRMM